MKLSTFVASLFFCSAFCAEMPLGGTGRDFDAISEMTVEQLADYGKDLNAFEINEIARELRDRVPIEHLAHLLDSNVFVSELTEEELMKFGVGNHLDWFNYAASFKKEQQSHKGYSSLEEVEMRCRMLTKTNSEMLFRNSNPVGLDDDTRADGLGGRLAIEYRQDSEAYEVD